MSTPNPDACPHMFRIVACVNPRGHAGDHQNWNGVISWSDDYSTNQGQPDRTALAPNSVDALADALLTDWDAGLDKNGRDRLCAELRTLARTSAKAALEEAAEVFATAEGVEATMFANDNVEAVRATEKWMLERAATYTTPENPA